LSASGFIPLAVASIALFAAGAFLAVCARLRSLAELLVAAYVLGWTWLVLIAFGLSTVDLVTPAGLLISALAVLAVSLAVWVVRARPPFPRLPSLAAVRGVLSDPILLALSVIALFALAYSVALAVGVAPNDWDALTYHISRAALWKQQHAIGLIAHPNDDRLNINPPIAEIAQLFALTLDGTDRFVNGIQLTALIATSIAVYATARRLGLDARAGAFGALAFALLPLPLLQASSALTDLVVASFLVAATCFVLSTRPAELTLGGLALALAIGSKFTGPLALPVVGAVALLGPARKRLGWVLVAGAVAVAAGSFWYVVNFVVTGRPDGNAGQSGPQTINWIGWRARQYLFGELQFPGGRHGGVVECLVAGLVLIALSVVFTLRSSRWGRWLLVGGLVTAILPALAFGAAWLLDRSGAEASPLARSPDTALSWYGPVALLLGIASFVLVRQRIKARRMPSVALLLAAAPIAALVTLLLLSYDPWRGRFFAYSVALSAATWGIALGRRSIAVAAVGLTGTMAVISLGEYLSKPSGSEIVNERSSIFDSPRVEQQLILRSSDGGASAIRFLSKHAPDDAHVALSLEGDDYLSPYFGPRYRRHITFVDPARRVIPADADWVVAASSLPLNSCAWADTGLVSGWHIYRRTSARCPQP
jgi:hypothetical protein